MFDLDQNRVQFCYFCSYGDVSKSCGYLTLAVKYMGSFSLLLFFFFTFSGDETRQRVKFTDDRVCKSHLLNCCPHDILSGTVSKPYLKC